MKRMILTILLALSAYTCHAQIQQVYDMKEVFDAFKDADETTLAIFDVDMVLVQPSDPAFQMANMKRYGAISKRIMKEVPPDKQMVFLSLMTTGSDLILIDERTPEYLDQLIQKQIPAIALTANLTGQFGNISKMEQWRVDGLRQLGIDFSASAPCRTPFIFDNLASYRGNYSMYLDGIIFVNGTTVTKGEALLAFLEKCRYCPKKIIFVDDRDENLKNMESTLQQSGKSIEYLGLHYLGALKYPSQVISEEQFESRWSELAAQAKTLP